MSNYEYFTVRGRKVSRWIPTASIKVSDKQGLGVAYVYNSSKGRLCVIGYAGQAGKSSIHYAVKDQNRAAVVIREFFDGLAQHKQMVENRRKQANAGHSLKVGDIITNSWGYDQTNVDWYRIVRTSRTFVWIQPICAQVEETGFMSGPSEPRIDTTDSNPDNWGFKDAKGSVEKHKAEGNHVSMRFGCGSKWDGQPKYCSWYA